MPPPIFIEVEERHHHRHRNVIPGIPRMMLSANVWRNATGVANPPDLSALSCALAMTDKGNTNILDGNVIAMWLSVPKFTDIRPANLLNGLGDIVQVPANSTSGRYYLVLSVDDMWKGLGNEYRRALLRQIPTWTFPIT